MGVVAPTFLSWALNQNCSLIYANCIGSQQFWYL